MPHESDCIESKSKVVGPGECATFRLRPQLVFRPDVFKIKASKNKPNAMQDVSDRMRLVQLEWCTVKYGGDVVDFAHVGVKRIGKVGPKIDLGGIEDRALIVAQDLLCTVENLLADVVTVSVCADGISVT